MALASYLPPYELLTHSQKVCRLYRAALRCLWDNYPDRLEYRLNAVLVRARFDEHKNEKNLIKAKQLLIAGLEEVKKNRHPAPRLWPDSYNAPAYDQTVEPPDWVLDFWDPMEKAQYPYYFAKREQRKKEYIEQWEKKYGKPNFEDYLSHH